MPELEKPDSPLATTNTKWRFPSVHPEGRKFLLIAAVASMAPGRSQARREAGRSAADGVSDTA